MCSTESPGNHSGFCYPVYTSYHESIPLPSWCGSFRTMHLLFEWPRAANQGCSSSSVYQFRHIDEILLWRTGKEQLQFLSCSLPPLRPEIFNPANDTAIKVYLAEGISCCLLLVIATCYLNITPGQKHFKAGRFENHTLISLWGLATLSWQYLEKQTSLSLFILLKAHLQLSVFIFLLF